MPQSLKRLLLFGVLVASSTAGAQAPMSARLLRRIAEAADGDRSGRPVYVIASTDSLNPVGGVFLNRDSATAAARRLGPNYGSYGPYVSQRPVREIGLWPIPPLAICVHDQYGSLMFPADSGHGRGNLPSRTLSQWLATSGGVRGMCVPPQMPVGPIGRVSIVFEYAQGGSWTVPLRPGSDAVFIGPAAIDKFVMPYYTTTLGVDAANTMRQQLLGTIERP